MGKPSRDTKRSLYALALFAVGLLSCLGLAVAAVAEEAGQPAGAKTDIGTQPVEIAPDAPKTVIRKAPRRSAATSRKRPSAFVLLGQRLLSGAMTSSDWAERGTSALDPANVERIGADAEMAWAFAPVLPVLPSIPATSAHQRLTGLAELAAYRPGTSSRRGRPEASLPESEPAAARDSAPLLTMGDLLMPSPEDAELFADTIAPADREEKNPGQAAPANAARGPAPLGYRVHLETMAVNAGVAWIDDLADANGLARGFRAAGLEDGSDKVGAVNLRLGASYRALTLTGGYIRAVDEPEQAAFSLGSGENDPIAWNSELAYATTLLQREATLALGYLRSSDALQLYLPEERYSTRASFSLFDATTLSVEYYLDKDAATGHEDEGDGYGVTTKFGVAF